MPNIIGNIEDMALDNSKAVVGDMQMKSSPDKHVAGSNVGKSHVS